MSGSYADITINDVASGIASAAMIFGGIIPYIPQYREIQRTEDATGFSLYVCLALLVANTLRILFWFGKHYELPLVFQSILMIVTMLFMVKLCVNVSNKNQIIKAKNRIFTDFDTKYFWKWTDFQSYVQFMLLFGSIGGFIMYIFINSELFVELVGLLAVLTEAMLGVPQFFRNFIKRSTEGMSLAMVTMWTVGDTFKTCYFIHREAPIQFGICGVLQVIIDIGILLQVYFYPLRELARPDTRTE